MKNDLGPTLGKVLSKEELEMDDPSLSFRSIEIPPFNLGFHQGGEEIGRFYEEDGKLCFDGDLSESGKIFVDYVAKYHNDNNKQIKIDAALEAIGWMHAEACVSSDNGEDIRKIDIPDVIKRAIKDLGL